MTVLAVDHRNSAGDLGTVHCPNSQQVKPDGSASERTVTSVSFLKLAYIISARRIISSWKLELALLIGITAAVALMSSGVVFSDLLADVALRQTLKDASPEEANISVRAFNNLEDPEFIRWQDTVYKDTLDMVYGRVSRRLDEYTKERVYVVETITFLFQGHPQLELDFDVRPGGASSTYRGCLTTRREAPQGEWSF